MNSQRKRTPNNQADSFRAGSAQRAYYGGRKANEVGSNDAQEVRYLQNFGGSLPSRKPPINDRGAEESEKQVRIARGARNLSVKPQIMKPTLTKKADMERLEALQQRFEALTKMWSDAARQASAEARRARAKGNGWHNRDIEGHVRRDRAQRGGEGHHEHKIMQQTLRMPDAMLGVMGGPNKETAEQVLRSKYGYSRKEIASLKGDEKYATDSLARAMRSKPRLKSDEKYATDSLARAMRKDWSDAARQASAEARRRRGGDEPVGNHVPSMTVGAVLDHKASQTGPRPIHQIAREIRREWGSKVNYAAKPYLDAMHSLSSVHDKYIMDSGHDVVARFLGNASTFRGPKAKELKAELKTALKQPLKKWSDSAREASAAVRARRDHYNSWENRFLAGTNQTLIGYGKNAYTATHGDRKVDVMANSIDHAQRTAATHFGVKPHRLIGVMTKQES